MSSENKVIGYTTQKALKQISIEKVIVNNIHSI